ncbi:hypothetical protein JRQ81_000701 [Phrynocephalus forsythii]|uniref:Uncharacterized protein n=1 Tax=Phrynocephalus forsythii TaxID=171643 RepID=A0A9Q0Y731_9SAUR|nr:hypothetical protein JRQ81_000701 [Phrynocephalus forsythii]
MSGSSSIENPSEKCCRHSQVGEKANTLLDVDRKGIKDNNKDLSDVVGCKLAERLSYASNSDEDSGSRNREDSPPVYNAGKSEDIAFSDFRLVAPLLSAPGQLSARNSPEARTSVDFCGMDGGFSTTESATRVASGLQLTGWMLLRLTPLEAAHQQDIYSEL